MLHHEFGASSLSRYHKCPLSYQLSKGIKDIESEDANLGTLLHKAVENDDIEIAPLEHQWVVEFSLKYLDAVIKKHNPKEIIKEKLISVKDETGKEISFGTADVVLVCDDYCVVLDWKMLFGVHTEAQENIQLAFYSLGLSQEYNVNKVTAILAQPQLRECSEYEFTAFASILKLIKKIINKCKSPLEELEPNPSLETCKFCKGKVRCKAMKENTYEVVGKQVFDIRVIDDSQLIELFEACKMVEKYQKVVKAELEERIRNNVNAKIGDYSLKPCKGRKKFNDVNSVCEKLQNFIDKETLLNLVSLPVGKTKTTFIKKYSVLKGCNKQEAELVWWDIVGDKIDVGNDFTKLEKGK